VYVRVCMRVARGVSRNTRISRLCSTALQRDREITAQPRRPPATGRRTNELTNDVYDASPDRDRCGIDDVTTTADDDVTGPAADLQPRPSEHQLCRRQSAKQRRRAQRRQRHLRQKQHRLDSSFRILLYLLENKMSTVARRGREGGAGAVGKMFEKNFCWKIFGQRMQNLMANPAHFKKV